MTYAYSIFDGDPNEDGSPAWPTHNQVVIRATPSAELDVQHVMSVEAAGLYRSDGYEPGQTLRAIIWDASGQVVGRPTYTITAEDLGEDDAEDEPDHQARLQLAAAHVEATDLGDDQWAYYAEETGRYYVVSASDLEDLCDYLDDEDSSIISDAYSHWCADTTAAEQPEGWEPGDEVAS